MEWQSPTDMDSAIDDHIDVSDQRIEEDMAIPLDENVLQANMSIPLDENALQANMIKNKIAMKLLLLKAQVNFTQSNFAKVYDILAFSLKNYNENILKILKTAIDGGVNDWDQVFQTMDHNNYLPDIRSESKQKMFYAQNLVPIPDFEQVHLGERNEISNGKQRKIQDYFQYMSPIKSLSSYLHHIDFDHIFENSNNSEPYNYKSFRDGKRYLSNDLQIYRQKNKNAFHLLLNADGVSITNPLGASCSKHRYYAFYYRVLDLEIETSSKPTDIIPILYVNENLIGIYGFDKILKKFIEDMKQLGSDDGVRRMIGGQVRNLKAIILAFTADTKAYHEVSNYFAAGGTIFCRRCTISRSERIESPSCETIARRDLEWYNRIEWNSLTEIRQRYYGVHGPCALNELPFFHITNNITFDYMHDILEGVANTDVMLFFATLYHCFSVGSDEMNTLIRGFDYGESEKRNIPVPNISNTMFGKPYNCLPKLKQKASQMGLLIRALPFIFINVRENIDENFPAMKLILKLNKILRICESPSLTEYSVTEIGELVRQHDELKWQKFPGCRKNKDHHLLHYSEMIQQYGPIFRLSCFNFEQANRLIVEQMNSTKNYRNVTFSLMKRQSILIAYSTADKFNSSNIQINHKYRGPIDEDLKFAIIQRIFFLEDKIHFVLKEIVTLEFDEILSAYVVEHSPTFLFTDISYMTFWTGKIKYE
uniref:Uncharacterized protein LOC113794332 n=1 Tax=Dermatophagoides pteronyssinus TaxID=6956 RepID=A0A6P6Y6U8_DERPT|nr:uncharacterized protein LOC113794332 [Dermatophagoides pteronyssinus]